MNFSNAKVVDVGINPVSYHKPAYKRGDAHFIVSPSMLKEFMRCPRRWRDGYNPPESDAKDYGSLLDCRLLTPDHFQERFAIQPETYINEDKETKPWSNNAKVCRAWNAEQERLGCEVVKMADVAMADNAISRLNSDPVIAAWIKASETQVHVMGDWMDKATGLTIPCQCLLDFVPRLGTEFEECLGDLKSSRSGALVPFTRFCFTMGYHTQAAFDTDIYKSATGEERLTWCIIGQENYAPWQPFKRIIVDDFKDIGRATYRHALTLYARCLKTDVWPDYDSVEDSAQGWAFCRPEPWMAFEALEKAMEQQQTSPTEEERIDILN